MYRKKYQSADEYILKHNLPLLVKGRAGMFGASDSQNTIGIVC